METIFISGTTHTTDLDSEFYRKELPEAVRAEIDRHMNGGDKFVIGDAPGIDTQAQDYINSKGYTNVEIYTSGNTVRYLATPSWQVCHIPCFGLVPDSEEWHAQKDIVMSTIADMGIAVPTVEGSRATKTNILQLFLRGKFVLVNTIYSCCSEDDTVLWWPNLWDMPYKAIEDMCISYHDFLVNEDERIRKYDNT